MKQSRKITIFNETALVEEYFLLPCSLDSRPHLYCSSSLGSTDRTTGLLSTQSRKGVSCLVLYTSPASHKRIKVVNAFVITEGILVIISVLFTHLERRRVKRRAAPPLPLQASAPRTDRTWTPRPGRRSYSRPWLLPAAEGLPWTNRETKTVGLLTTNHYFTSTSYYFSHPLCVLWAVNFFGVDRGQKTHKMIDWSYKSLRF